MALTERKEIDLEVRGPFKMVQVREATIIEKDGVEVSRSYHRRVITPSDSKTGESSEIKAVCSAVQTSEVKAAYVANTNS